MCVGAFECDLLSNRLVFITKYSYFSYMELNEKFKMDRSSAKVFKKGEEPKPFGYWLTQSPQKRLEAIEFLRQQYHGYQSRLLRIYRVTQPI